MKPYKKPKYRMDPKRFDVKPDQEMTPHQIYEQMLKDKFRKKR